MQQGDPLGPLLFALAVQPLAREERMGPHDTVVAVRWWDRESWDLRRVALLRISRESSCADFERQLRRVFGVQPHPDAESAEHDACGGGGVSGCDCEVLTVCRLEGSAMLTSREASCDARQARPKIARKGSKSDPRPPK